MEDLSRYILCPYLVNYPILKERGDLPKIRDTFLKCKDLNDYYDYKIMAFTDFDIFNTVREDPIIIYDSNFNYLGFFLKEIDFVSNAVGGSLWLLDGSSSLLKDGIFCICAFHYLESNDAKYVEINTWSKFISNFLEKIIPGIKTYKVRKNYFICHGKTKKLDLSIFEGSIWKNQKLQSQNCQQLPTSTYTVSIPRLMD